MMLTPNSERDQADGHTEQPASVNTDVEGQPPNSAEEALHEAIDYFRHQPVPIKKSRSLWPFWKPKE